MRVAGRQQTSEPHIDRDVAPFGIGRRTGRLQLRRRPAGRAAMAVGPKGGPVACGIGKESKGRGRRGVFQVPTACRIANCCMTHLAPDPHPEDAVAGGPGRGVRAVLLLRCAPRVFASQGVRVGGSVTAPRVPAIGGERPAHEGHGPRAFAGCIGLAGDGDGPATGIGAGRVVEFDPAADARTVGAMGTGPHAEGCPVRRVQGLDRQVVDHAAQGLVVHSGGGQDQVLVQIVDVSASGTRHL